MLNLGDVKCFAVRLVDYDWIYARVGLEGSASPSPRPPISRGIPIAAPAGTGEPFGEAGGMDLAELLAYFGRGDEVEFFSAPADEHAVPFWLVCAPEGGRPTAYPVAERWGLVLTQPGAPSCLPGSPVRVDPGSLAAIWAPGRAVARPGGTSIRPR